MKFNLKNIKKLQKKGEKLRKKQEKQEIKDLILTLEDRIKRNALNDETSILYLYNSYEHKNMKIVGKYFTDLGFTVQIQEDEYRIADTILISWDFD